MDCGNTNIFLDISRLWHGCHAVHVGQDDGLTQEAMNEGVHGFYSIFAHIGQGLPDDIAFKPSQIIDNQIPSSMHVQLC